MSAPAIRRANRKELTGLVALLEAVGASAAVGFMASPSGARATAFWSGALAAAYGGERVVLVTEADGGIVGTVPDNRDPSRDSRGSRRARRDPRSRWSGSWLRRAGGERRATAFRSGALAATGGGCSCPGGSLDEGFVRTG